MSTFIDAFFVLNPYWQLGEPEKLQFIGEQKHSVRYIVPVNAKI